jgi:hypothetical protein
MMPSLLLLYRMSAESAAAPSLLLELPAACLLQVLQYCAVDQRSLLNAARAHSRLHQAAVQVLHSIHAVMTQQQQHDSVLLYLSKHGCHVQDMRLQGGPDHMLSLSQLPPDLQLYSIQLLGLFLSFEALQDAARMTSLQQLRLSDCKLPDSDWEALATALSQLPAGLEHLSISKVIFTEYVDAKVPTAVLAKLQQLTYLELAKVFVLGSEDEAGLALQPLQALTRLVDLRLVSLGDQRISASMLSGTHGLTRLDLNVHWSEVEAVLLAGKTLLQHLNLNGCSIAGGSIEGQEQLLSQLQHMQQLTYLSLDLTLCFHLPEMYEEEEGDGELQWGPPTSAYAALTASSKLQHLEISSCRMPVGAWQHVFPAGRQLPLLQELDISYVEYATRGVPALGPEGNCLVSCCPGLRVLDVQCCEFSTQVQAALQGLSRLVSLNIAFEFHEWVQGLESLCPLTALRDLRVKCLDFEREGFLQLTQLTQLTRLQYEGMLKGRLQHHHLD